METIKQLAGHIREEIKDATTYAHEAIEAREQDPVLAELYHRLSMEELKHMDMLHTEVVREIEAWKRETGEEAPPEMQARYDMLHEIIIEDAKEAKILVQMYKEA